MKLAERESNDKVVDLKSVVREKLRKLEGIRMAYNTSCACEGYQTYKINKFPLPIKHFDTCLKCHQEVDLTQTMPPIMYLPELHLTFGLVQLQLMNIIPTKENKPIRDYQRALPTASVLRKNLNCAIYAPNGRKRTFEWKNQDGLFERRKNNSRSTSSVS